MFENVTQKNITDKWLELISRGLERLEVSIIRMKEGCVDLMEFLPMINQEDEIKRLQYKNLGLVITELTEILKKVKHAIPNKDYDLMYEKINACNTIYHNKISIPLYSNSYSARTRNHSFNLTPSFKLFCDEISEVHEQLISNLRNILWLPGNIKRLEVSNVGVPNKPEE